MHGSMTKIGHLSVVAFVLLGTGLLHLSTAAQVFSDDVPEPFAESSRMPAFSDVNTKSGCDVSAQSAPSVAEPKLVVSGARYLQGPANQLEGNTAYSDYMVHIAQRRSQFYLSRSDGRLLAFDAATNEQVFTFIPPSVLAKQQLHAESDSYLYRMSNHPVVADVYANGHWRTLLVSSFGAAGQGLFALDITDPDAIQLLWELAATDEVLSAQTVKLGYSFTAPSIARLHNGQWAVLAGNGYQAQGAEDGAAALYIIDAVSGALIKSLTVQSNLTTANGLSAPRLADYDGDSIADYAYAGDLHGNLWRFDLFGEGAVAAKTTPPSLASYGAKAGSSKQFKVSYAGRPLFIARVSGKTTRQAIIAAPSLIRHPSQQGYLVLLGTGHPFVMADRQQEAYAHSVYGIWDMQTKAEVTTAETISHDQLTEQNITSATVGIGSTSGQQRKARIISNNPIEWHSDFAAANSVKQRGWRLDLQTTEQSDGEMLLENMHTLGSMLLLQTQVSRADPCVDEDSYWLYAINPHTGGATLHHALDTQTDAAGIVSAIQFDSSGAAVIQQDEQGFIVHSADDQERITPAPDSYGRQSWRILVGP